MKELNILSIEEKAKRYDEAIEKFNAILNLDTVKERGTIFTDDVRKILPELKENEDERIRKVLLGYFSRYQKEEVFLNNITMGDIVAWLEKQSNKNEIDYDEELKKCKANPLYFFDKYVKVKLKKQKPTWSKEDERHFSWLIEHLGQSAGLYDNLIDWLKSLKDRVLPQSKQEWKQENTDDLNDFENAMMHIGNSFFGQYAGLDPNNTNAIKEQANLLLEFVPNKEWSEEDERIYRSIICSFVHNFPLVIPQQEFVKSLKDRHTWKPSDEQMEALLYEVNAWDEDSINGQNLKSLYQDLKKLREE